MTQSGENNKKKHIGKCRICGQTCELTFEHIPPYSSGNNSPQKFLTKESLRKLITDKKRMPWETENLKFKSLQRGTGFYSLCEKCNNLMGAYYGNEYVGFAREVSNYIIANKEKINDNKYFESIVGIHPLSFIKQVISMFCTTTDLSEDYPYIKELLLDKNKICNDPDFKISMFILKSGNYLSTGKIVLLNSTINQIKTRIISEMDLFPFGFVLDYDKNYMDSSLLDITSFLNYSYEERINFKIIAPMYERNSGIPLDFRTKDEIRDNI